MKKHLAIIASLFATLALGGSCDKAGESKPGAENTAAAPENAAPAAAETAPSATAETETAPSADLDLSTAKKSMETQLALLMAGDVQKLKGCFTQRQQERITQENVDKGKSEAGSMAFEEIYAEEIPGEFEGVQTMKVKMKNGRTLTTLNLIDGKWLSDTVWFK